MEFEAAKKVQWRNANAPTSITLGTVFYGQDGLGLGGVQVAVAESEAPPSRPALRELFDQRKGKKQITLVVAVTCGNTTSLIGPDPQALPIDLPTEQAKRQLQSVLNEPDVLAAAERLAGFRKAKESTALSGFTNSGLFATHHLVKNVPAREDWASRTGEGQAMLSARGSDLVKALGFTPKPAGSGAFVLSTTQGSPRAVAVLLDDSEQFESKSARFPLSPVAFGLAVATQKELPWLVVLRKDQIRLYPGVDGVGVGSKGQAETYFEIDLATVDSDYAALLPLIFSAEALSNEGSAEVLLRESALYAAELGTRLRERIYDEVVPVIAVEVAEQIGKSVGMAMDAEGLATAYRVTLRILFRLLFQAYAEDRGLLPSGRNEGYDANSLKTNATRLLESGSDDFGEAATIWLDLVQVWNAIDQGNPQWQIPPYNGGLFATDPVRSPDGNLITHIQLPDRVLAPALRSLLLDRTTDGASGPVDFRSLSVREFGTIYEGLLESSLSLAEQDLTVTRQGSWVPAQADDEVAAQAGQVYFHSASGERKATGSYFTPKVVVDHLVERSLVPVLEAHLDKIADYLHDGDAATASREFFDFRVADLAMGSGHFLVAAVDKIESMMRTFLTQHSVPEVTAELARLSRVAKDALGTDDVAKSEVDEVSLLRRQVARRCIYGLDINPMAVELARLAVWIHTFVPGLPMSNLDHGLVVANSLTGIGTVDEALDALQPGRRPGALGLFDDVVTTSLSSARDLLVDVANASEADKAEVARGSALLAAAAAAAEPARKIFDVAVAVRLGAVSADAVFSEEGLLEKADDSPVTDLVSLLQPAHMPYLFPEVFLREDPGFDVLIGNPPWEKLKVETDQWWGLRLPGLRGMPQEKKIARLEEFRASRPDLEVEFAREQESVKELNSAIKKGPFPLGAGDRDLFQVFCWRNWQLVRAGGRTSLVLPRGALSGSALGPWRRDVLTDGAFEEVTFLTNSGNWIFDNVDGRYTIGLTVVSKGSDAVVRFSGPFRSERELLAGRDDIREVTRDDFLTWSANASFPLLPNSESPEVFLTYRNSPRFDATADDWAFRPLRELDASGDKELLEFDTGESRDRIPVVTGASFNFWDPDFGKPYGYAEVNVLRQRLRTKLSNALKNPKSAYFGTTYPDGELPMDRARIAFRDVARSTDTRTTLTCLIPSGSSAVHKAPVLVRQAGTARAEALLLGVLSSIPLDWYARRWVEMTMSFEILNSLPIPRPELDSTLASRVIEISGRLAAVDERYADWAAEVGVPVGSVKSPEEKEDLIAELDALVALLYGLTADQVEHVFATFHYGWDYQPRLEAVLAHYSHWKDSA